MSDDGRQENTFQSKLFRMVLSLVVIIVVATLALETAYFATQETIQLNRQTTIRKNVLRVLGFYESWRASGQVLDPYFVENVEEKNFDVGGKPFNVWLGKGADGAVSGVAVRMTGGGFQGIVDIVVGLTPDLAKTTGFEVIESGETPGLGDEMRQCKGDFASTPPEKCFKKWFYQGIATEPNVEFVKYKAPDKANQFTAITGATYTSTAIKSFLNAALAKLRQLKDAGALTFSGNS